MATNFDTIKQVCSKSRELTRRLIDEFLLYFCADRFNLDREVNKQFSRFRHITREAPDEWINMLKAQYIVYRIFEEGGFINKVINHRALSHLDEEERTFLKLNREHPWRFSFSVIIGNPFQDFYEMEDIFTGDTFLLYSPGTTEVLENEEVLLWFNLINYNGSCWETYGVIGHYRSFEPQDIIFLASQLYPNKEFEDIGELVKAVSKNPVPFMILVLISDQPLIFNGEDQMVQKCARFIDDDFDSSFFSQRFIIEYSNGVYRLSLKGWNTFPHYSYVYYDEKKEELFLSAMSDRGYTALIDELNDCGYQLPYEPDFRVNMGMIVTAQELLKKDIQLNPYEALFGSADEPGDEEALENINDLLSAIILGINAGVKPDAQKLAAKFDVDEETAQELIDRVWEKYGRTT